MQGFIKLAVFLTVGAVLAIPACGFGPLIATFAAIATTMGIVRSWRR